MYAGSQFPDQQSNPGPPAVGPPSPNHWIYEPITPARTLMLENIYFAEDQLEEAHPHFPLGTQHNSGGL